MEIYNVQLEIFIGYLFIFINNRLQVESLAKNGKHMWPSSSDGAIGAHIPHVGTFLCNPPDSMPLVTQQVNN